MNHAEPPPGGTPADREAADRGTPADREAPADRDHRRPPHPARLEIDRDSIQRGFAGLVIARTVNGEGRILLDWRAGIADLGRLILVMMAARSVSSAAVPRTNASESSNGSSSSSKSSS